MVASSLASCKMWINGSKVTQLESSPLSEAQESPLLTTRTETDWLI